MMTRKMAQLTAMALVAIAFAVPASASAQATWTDNHVHLSTGAHAGMLFEGRLGFTTPSPPLPVHTTFSCEISVTITAIGPRVGKINAFTPTTSTCVGTGVFTGCVLAADTSNVTHVAEEETVNTWDINLNENGTTAAVTHNGGGNLTILNTYAAGCAVPGSHLQFASATLTPTVDVQGTVTHIHFSATATNGVTVLSGSLTPGSSPTLGIAGIT